MKVYFAGSIIGNKIPNQDERNAAIIKAIRDQGHTITSEHQLVVPGDMHLWTPEAVYARDIQWIDEADVLIAEVSAPSHGVGYEIRYAEENGKEVLCLYSGDVRPSWMLIGNENIFHHAIEREEDIPTLIAMFFDEIRLWREMSGRPA